MKQAMITLHSALHHGFVIFPETTIQEYTMHLILQAIYVFCQSIRAEAWHLGIKLDSPLNDLPLETLDEFIDCEDSCYLCFLEAAAVPSETCGEGSLAESRQL